MKLLIRLLVSLAVLFGSVRVIPRQTGPVTVEMVSPINGSTVGGTIAVSCRASSTVAPITKVEFYRDGVLFATVYPPLPPTNVHIFQ